MFRKAILSIKTSKSLCYTLFYLQTQVLMDLAGIVWWSCLKSPSLKYDINTVSIEKGMWIASTKYVHSSTSALSWKDTF